MLVFRLLALLCACALLSLAADDLPKGVIIDKVVCRNAPDQSYALYLPSNYTPTRSWPILYGLDPGGRGRIPVALFAEAAERAGVIVIGSNNSRNGSTAFSRDAIQAFVPDTHSRFSIDDSKVFAAGFSGGARVALSWASQTALAGVIAVGGSYWGDAPKQVRHRIYAAAGTEDFNNSELWKVCYELSRHGTPLRFVEFEGGHSWLPANLTAEALDFMLGRIPAVPIEETPVIHKTIDLEDEFRKDVLQAGETRAGTFGRLRKISQREADTPERRAARRVLNGNYAVNWEFARDLMSKKEYATAADRYQDALAARPEVAAGWYNLAVARAAARNKRGSYEALRKAIELGLKGRERVDAEPFFEPFRADPKFQAIVASIPAPAPK